VVPVLEDEGLHVCRVLIVETDELRIGILGGERVFVEIDVLLMGRN